MDGGWLLTNTVGTVTTYSGLQKFPSLMLNAMLLYDSKKKYANDIEQRVSQYRRAVGGGVGAVLVNAIVAIT